jgi:hypothetical protein
MFVSAFASHAICPYPEPDKSSTKAYPISWESILLLSSHLRPGLPSGFFHSGFPTKTLYATLLIRIRATCPTPLFILDLIIRTIFGLSLSSVFHSPVTPTLLTQISLSAPYSLTPSVIVSPWVWKTKFHTHRKQQEELYFCVLLDREFDR